jgi:membrane-bound lytic murein transglycosylase D
MRHKIYLSRIIICTLFVPVVLICMETRLLSWGLFNLFTDTRYTLEGLLKVEAFDPDRDILYLPPVSEKDIFESTRDLSICRNRAVRKHIYLYLTSKREYLIRAIQASYRYNDVIGEVLKKHSDLPEELSLLPLLESCFNPYAVSSSKAVGLWQFVDNTARPLGLKRDKWIDERRNIEKSTEAALRHLRNMRRIFPRWDLALAAYNGGAGYLKRTMDKAGIKDFWKLRECGQLRDETSEYIPKYIALMVIYKNQRLFGIKDEIAIPEKHDIQNYTLRQPVDLRDVERITGVTVQHIMQLNPELNTTITPPEIKQYKLRLPSDAKKKIEEKPDDLYKIKITGIIRHCVKKGDTLSKIARQYKKKLN